MLGAYYDTEWGMPVRDERGLYERICLEGFQAGLSWATILSKRPALRRAFDGFYPDRVAAFDDSDVERLLSDDGIVRNRRKIEAAVTNERVADKWMQHATPRNAQRRDPAAGKPAAKWPQHAPCGHFAVTEAIEQQRTRANGVPRSPVFSGVFARVRWPSRDMKESGRPDSNRGPHRPERCALPGCATPRRRPSIP
jgi:hypothetical protein